MLPTYDIIQSDVLRALAEDIGSGDVSAHLIPATLLASAEVISREPMIVCGIPWFNEVMLQVDPQLGVTWLVSEGQWLDAPMTLCHIQGPARSLLTAERTALNFLQTLSATATQTYRYVLKLKPYPTRLLDTRKTIPGLRLAQKYAVSCAGGLNHRLGLYDAFLIKENHIKACGSIRHAIDVARKTIPKRFVEIEVETLEEFREALEAKPDRILLDNFSLKTLEEAVQINKTYHCELEASGGVDLSTIEAIAKTGVDYISVGSITKSIQAIESQSFNTGYNIMKKIVFTGGGTAGHVTPNIALIEALSKDQWQIDYIGSLDGVEKSMIEGIGIPYHAVKSGKLRRYFSLKNFIDPLNVLMGIGQSYFLLRKIRPNVVFSKGGFVALPVVIGAFLNRIPVIAHESDMTPGLANRLSFPFVSKICVTFDAAKRHFKQPEKVIVTGTPIRKQLFEGDKQCGLKLAGFSSDKPCVLVVGGSQGSTVLNAAVRNGLSELTAQFQVIHLCGKGKLDESLSHVPGYFQLEYANQELPDLLAASDVVVSRSGANSLCEILALRKPHVLVPLPLTVSRGDQIHNADYFKKQGISTVLEDASLTSESLRSAINDVWANRDVLIMRMDNLKLISATDQILKLIDSIST